MNDFESDEASPEMPLAFDADHRPIAVTHPIYEAANDDHHQDDAAQRRDIIAGLLRLLASGKGDCAATGRRLLVTAYLCGALPDCQTDAELARRLTISRARVSQIIREIKGVLPSLAKCNRRQN